MPTAEVNGINLYYEDQGSGYPVVFLHGYGSSAYVWKHQTPVLSRNCRFITYDARGHGRSSSPPTPDQYSIDIALEDLRQLLGSLNITRAVLGGLSMGGYICLRFYRHHPELVTALILTSTGPGYRNPAHMAKWNQEMETKARILETEGIIAFADYAQAKGELTYLPREVILQHNPIGLANMARKVAAQYDSQVIDHISEIEVPTLIVAGENDTPFLAAADYMAKTIRGAKRVVIPKAGHAANVDNVAAFNHTVTSFLDGLRLK